MTTAGERRGSDRVGTAAGWSQLDLLDRVVRGIELTEAEAAASDRLYGGVGMLRVFLGLATMASWFAWLHAVYKNLHHVGSRTTRFTSGWVIGYWFIPFVNPYRPYQIMRELWGRSRERNETLDYDFDAPAGSSLLVGWWSVWILSGILGRISFRQSMAADDLASFITSTRSEMWSDVTSILAAVLAFAIVRQIDTLQRDWPKKLFFGAPRS
jgi:hypothetical protein